MDETAWRKFAGCLEKEIIMADETKRVVPSTYATAPTPNSQDAKLQELESRIEPLEKLAKLFDGDAFKQLDSNVLKEFVSQFGKALVIESIKFQKITPTATVTRQPEILAVLPLPEVLITKPEK
jgi:hypothetical protein